MGIEPTLFAWEARVLPLNDTRARSHCSGKLRNPRSRPSDVCDAPQSEAHIFGFKIGRGLFFISAAMLYQAVGISFSCNKNFFVLIFQYMIYFVNYFDLFTYKVEAK